MPELSIRSAQLELMDDLSCEGPVIGQTLRELNTINKWLGGNNVTVNGVKILLKDKLSNLKHAVTIGDLGCGGGDIMLTLAKWADKRNVYVRLIGIDANPHIVAYAKENTKQYDQISYTSENIFSQEFKEKRFDVIIATLFLHHFTNDELISFFKQLKDQVRIGIVVNDIHRHWFAYHSIRLLTKYFSKSYMVRNDAALSVLRSFRKEDFKQILSAAGITNYTLRWRWAFRWQLIIRCKDV